ncbi:MAG: protease inhibitor I42 family protein [Sphingobacteriaceae bacterium]|nr:protease inhibitor I42 family protein [Sphingobacteriaceae bacterium]
MKNLFFIVALFLASCSYQTIKVNDAQPCKVKLNKKFRINLPEDHRTGYTWQLNDEYDKSLLDRMNTVWEGNDNGVYFYFTAVKPGITILNFTSRNYNDINSIKEITIKVSED